MPSDPADAIVAVPLRSFATGNARLASELGPSERVELGRRMANAVVDAAGSLDTVVVSSAADVVEWATSRRLTIVDDPGSLDGAADAAREYTRRAGRARVVIVHADLPFATTLEHVARHGAEPVAVLVPDQRDDGTPVIAVPVDAPFRFAYGPGSFRRHLAESERCRLTVEVVRDPDLGFDVDVPEDLGRLRARRR